MNGPAVRRPLPWLILLFTLLCLPLLLTTRTSNYTWDETSFHLPAVRQIREHWPRLDVVKDSLSAISPGYHYILATVSLVTGTGTLPLRLVNFGVSLALLVLLCRAWPATAAARLVFFAVLPLAVSNFFVKSASYLVTDNAALLATAAALLGLFLVPSPRGLGWTSVLATLSVFIRQSGAWLAGALAVRIITEPGGLRPGPRWLLTLPPFVVVGWLVWHWHGLVPPIWQQTLNPESGVTLSAGAYLIGVLALLAPCYYAAARPTDWRADLRGIWPWLGATAGLALALVAPTTSSYEAGRWGGYLWDLSARFPAPAGRSIVFLGLAPFGGAMLALLGRRLWVEAGRETALVWLAAYGAWAVSGLANRQIFHRYYEPTTLLLLICWLLLVCRARRDPAGLDFRPLVLLGLAQLGLTLLTAHGRTFGFI